jgi:catechol 2,3-dioxygenase-like lactoylglutathione lyase family enzyme
MPDEIHTVPGNEVTSLLSDAMLVTTVAVTDLERAKQFFHEQLGLSPLEETPFAIRFAAGKGTQFSVRRGQPNTGQTVGHFEVDDLESVVRDLTARGVTFEEYETPKTINFIAQIGPARGAWFKDPDGNVFGVREGPVPGVA